MDNTAVRIEVMDKDTVVVVLRMRFVSLLGKRQTAHQKRASVERLGFVVRSEVY